MKMKEKKVESKKIVVETLDEFDFTPDHRTRRSQYDWDTLFNGEIHKLVGVSKTFEITFAKNAEKHGLIEHVYDDNGNHKVERHYEFKRLSDDTVVFRALSQGSSQVTK